MPPGTVRSAIPTVSPSGTQRYLKAASAAGRGGIVYSWRDGREGIETVDEDHVRLLAVLFEIGEDNSPAILAFARGLLANALMMNTAATTMATRTQTSFGIRANIAMIATTTIKIPPADEPRRLANWIALRKTFDFFRTLIEAVFHGNDNIFVNAHETKITRLKDRCQASLFPRIPFSSLPSLRARRAFAMAGGIH